MGWVSEMAMKVTFDGIDFDDEIDDLPDEPPRTDDPSESDLRQLKRRVRSYVNEYAEIYGHYNNLRVPGDDETLSLIYEISDDGRKTGFGAKCIPYRNDNGDVAFCKLQFVWAYYARLPWDDFTAIIRHEMAHAIDYIQNGDGGHTPRFRDIADSLHAVTHIDSDTHAEVIDHRYSITCTECNLTAHRNKASEVVKNPHTRMCPECETDTLVVTHNISGEEWTDYDGYGQVKEIVESRNIDW